MHQKEATPPSSMHHKALTPKKNRTKLRISNIRSFTPAEKTKKRKPLSIDDLTPFEELKAINLLLLGIDSQLIKIERLTTIFANRNHLTYPSAKRLKSLIIEHANNIATTEDNLEPSIIPVIRNYFLDMSMQYIIAKIDVVKVVYSILKELDASLSHHQQHKDINELYDEVDNVTFEAILNYHKPEIESFSTLCGLFEHMQPETQKKLAKLKKYDCTYSELSRQKDLSNLKEQVEIIRKNLYQGKKIIPNTIIEKIEKFTSSLENLLNYDIDANNFNNNLPSSEDSLGLLIALSITDEKELYKRFDEVLLKVIKRSLELWQEQSAKKIKKPLIKDPGKCFACLSMWAIPKTPTDADITEQLPKIAGYIEMMDDITEHSAQDYSMVMKLGK